MKTPRSLLVSWAAIWSLLACAAAPLRADDRPDSKTLFSASAYIEHVRFLASDERAGRFPGTKGIEQAAEYIAEQLKAAGCEPAGEDGTYFQTFEARGAKRLVEQDAIFEVSGLRSDWKLRQDWIPLPFSKPGEVEGPLAFAGYGIEAPDFGYDDYADFDAEGKVLLILRYEPRSEDDDAEFGGKNPSRHSTFRRKARMAKEHGAKALLIVNPPNRDPDRDELYPFDSYWARQTHGLPMIQISRKVANEILAKAGMPDLKVLQEELDQEREPLSTDLADVTVKINTGVQYVKTRNVMGLLPGDGSTDEIVVVGAHYDHEGIRPFGRGKNRAPQIFNGADDNASGTAGVLELARVFGQTPKTRRNILFMAFSAEELGLLGSRHFTDQPTVPLERIKAMVNLDMIGRFSQDKFTAYGTSSGAEFKELVKQAAEKVGVKCRPSRGMTNNSDHASFRRKKIPAVFLFTGMHKQYTKPDDDWELIDAEGGAKVCQMAYVLTRELADMQEGPTFVGAKKKKQEAAKTQPAEKPEAAKKPEAADRPKDDQPADGDAATPRRPRVRLGIIPGYIGQDDKGGLPVDGVSDDGPAKRAGIKEGDLIVKIGDQTIGDIYDYMSALGGFKAGDEVAIVVKRGDRRITLKVKLQGSARPPSDENK